MANYSTLYTVLEQVHESGCDEYAVKAGGCLALTVQVYHTC